MDCVFAVQSQPVSAALWKGLPIPVKGCRDNHGNPKPRGSHNNWPTACYIWIAKWYQNQYHYHLSLLLCDRLLLWSPSSDTSLSSACDRLALKCGGVLRPLNTLIDPACGTRTIRLLLPVPCVFLLVIQCPVDNWQHTPGDCVCPECLPQILGIELKGMCLGFPFFHVHVYTYSIAEVKLQPLGPGTGKRKDGV